MEQITKEQAFQAIETMIQLAVKSGAIQDLPTAVRYFTIQEYLRQEWGANKEIMTIKPKEITDGDMEQKNG